MSDRQNCGNCVFWWREGPPEDRDQGYGRWFCRRYPNYVARFPTDWCGEWTARQRPLQSVAA